MPLQGAVRAIKFSGVEHVGRSEDGQIGITLNADDTRIGVVLSNQSAARLLVLLLDALRKDDKGALEDRRLHVDEGVNTSFHATKIRIHVPSLKSGQFVLEFYIGDGLWVPLSFDPDELRHLVGGAAAALQKFDQQDEPLRN